MGLIDQYGYMISLIERYRNKKKPRPIRMYQRGFGNCFSVISCHQVLDSSKALSDDIGMILFHVRYLRTKVIFRQYAIASGTSDHLRCFFLRSRKRDWFACGHL